MFDAAGIDAAGVALTAVATLAAGLIGAYLGAQVQARREHAAWLRKERLTVCRAYLRNHDLNQPDVDEPESNDETYLLAAAAFYPEFELLGLQEIAVCSERLDRALWDVLDMCRDRVTPRDEYRAADAKYERLRSEWMVCARRHLGINTL